MNKTLDLAGIGIGPFNLSLAALLTPLSNQRSLFFERRSEFSWHPGMMLPDTQMQTSYLKDLVTPIDPTNPCSFLAYLVKQGRFYRFINADFARVPRLEFANYLRWAAEQLPNLRFNSEIQDISFDNNRFTLKMAGATTDVHSRHVVIGTGMTPYVPNWAKSSLGSSCLHSHHYATSDLSVTGKRVAIIGGGQSGAEIFLDLMSGSRGPAAEITWISRRPGLDPLDETAFTNEYFTPDYLRQFHALPPARKQPIILAHKLTGDGVSPATLQALSRYLYAQDFLETQPTRYRILPNREVYIMERSQNAYHLYMRNGFNNENEDSLADVVVFATGYYYALPACLASLKTRMDLDDDGLPKLGPNYQVPWDGPSEHRIYMQNAGRNSHGVADAQLSLAAWRSAMIINHLCGQDIYRVDPEPAPVHWSSHSSLKPAPHFEPAEYKQPSIAK